MDTCTKAGNDNSFSRPAQGRDAGRPLTSGVLDTVVVASTRLHVNDYYNNKMDSRLHPTGYCIYLQYLYR